ncbi:uncharacterized protein [Chironomus tepperi]|uniref:uncharacterized protein n=1 Tax=Chironomus tepperi TaxID=113505 RepID=UPI00391F76DF
MEIFIALQILFICVSQAVALKIYCDAIANPNTCKVTDIQVSSSSDQIVTNVFGRYQNGKSANDVTVIDARGLTLTRFPLNLSKFLPNIQTVFFEKGMTEIHKEELAQYPNLRELYASTNEIEVIEPDLFINNPNLHLVFFNGNKIKSVAPNVFDGLSKLTFLGLDANKCYSGHAHNNHEEAKELAKNIYKNCSPSTSSEHCASKQDFENFKQDLKSDIRELTEKLQKWKDETQSYIKLSKETCDNN